MGRSFSTTDRPPPPSPPPAAPIPAATGPPGPREGARSSHASSTWTHRAAGCSQCWGRMRRTRPPRHALARMGNSSLPRGRQTPPGLQAPPSPTGLPLARRRWMASPNVRQADDEPQNTQQSKTKTGSYQLALPSTHTTQQRAPPPRYPSGRAPFQNTNPTSIRRRAVKMKAVSRFAAALLATVAVAQQVCGWVVLSGTRQVSGCGRGGTVGLPRPREGAPKATVFLGSPALALASSPAVACTISPTVCVCVHVCAAVKVFAPMGLARLPPPFVLFTPPLSHPHPAQLPHLVRFWQHDPHPVGVFNLLGERGELFLGLHPVRFPPRVQLLFHEDGGVQLGRGPLHEAGVGRRQQQVRGCTEGGGVLVLETSG